jgi:hypothetical protein
MSPTTPTTVQSAAAARSSVDGIGSTRPIADPSGHIARASVSLTTATRGDIAVSSGRKTRPFLTATPIAAK